MSELGQASAFKRYRVIRKTAESDVITSFDLVPVDGSAPAPFRPGQFLTFRVDAEDEAAGTRHYSLSGDPSARNAYRVAVKREPSPAGRPDLPPGLMSNRWHDGVHVGDEVLARGPEGSFTLDQASTRPVVLLSGGVGLTPLVAMAHALAAEGVRKTWFIHACDSRKVQAFGPELRALASAAPNLTAHVLYRHVAAQDRPGLDHDGEGLVSRDMLQSLLPLDDYDFYLCGPTPFMEAVYGLLQDLGVRDERIRYEFFGPATILKRHKPVASPSPASAPAAPAASGAATIRFAASGLVATWTDGFDNLLEFAEAHGLAPAFSCRAGICNTCACTILAGEVDYAVEPLDQPPAGTALLCCARPRGDVTLSL